MGKNQKEKKKFMGLGEVFDLPRHVTTPEPLFQLSSNREIVVEGCVGLADYSSDCICIRTKKYIVSITGRGLGLKYLSDSIVQIKGFITGLTFDI